MDEPLSRWRYLFREPAGKRQIGGKFRSKWGYLEMSPGYNYQNMTDGFINTQVVSRGLDERTAKAYRLDLEKFYREVGQYYIYNIEKFIKANAQILDDIVPIIIDDHHAQDIDTDEDWKMAELKYKFLHSIL